MSKVAVTRAMHHGTVVSPAGWLVVETGQWVTSAAFWHQRCLQDAEALPMLCAVCVLRVPRLQAVHPQVGESAERLHKRYVQALLALGNEHGVQLELV